MVLHIAGHRQQGDIHRSLGAEPDELVACHLGLERRVIALAPARDQRIEAAWVDDDARQDVRADLAAFFQHDDFKLFACFVRQLFGPDRCGQTRRSPANDHEIEFHGFAFDRFAHILSLQAKTICDSPLCTYSQSGLQSICQNSKGSQCLNHTRFRH